MSQQYFTDTESDPERKRLVTAGRLLTESMDGPLREQPDATFPSSVFVE